MSNKWIHTRSLVFILMLIILTGCSAVRIQQLETKIRNVQKDLYVPPDAVLLDEYVHASHKKYVAPNCIVAYFETAYGVNRPLAEIIDEYYNHLTQDGWELDPLYGLQKTDNDIYLRKGEQVELVIYSFNAPGGAPSTTLPPEATQFTNIYVVALFYSEPSSLACKV